MPLPARAFAIAVTIFAVPALADKLPLPKASYSADVVFESSGRTSTGHVNVDGPKERRVVKSSAGVETTTIIRRDLGKIYLLQPQRHTAVEMRMAAAEAAGEIGAVGTDIDSLYGADALPVAQETVAGLQATKYQLEAETSPGLKVDAQVWSTDDGIIVKVVGKTSIDGGNPPARMELSNVTRAAQDDNLFEVPEGTTVISPGKIQDGTETGPPPAPAGATPPAAAKP